MKSSTWFRDLSPEEKEELKRELLAARIALKRLETILKNKIDTSASEIRKETHFDNPSWTHKLASTLGYERALQEVINLIKE